MVRISALYLEGPGVKSRSGEWLSWWFFMMFTSPSNQVPEHCIKLATTTSLHVRSCPLSTAVPSQLPALPLLNRTPRSTIFMQLFTAYFVNSNTLFIICIMSCPAFYCNISNYFLGIWFAMFCMFFKLVLFLPYFWQQKIEVGASNDLFLHSLAIHIRYVMFLCHKFI